METLASEMEGYYEADFIIDERKGKGGQTEYLVKYTRYNYYESTWEPSKNITRDILQAWNETDDKTKKDRQSCWKRSKNQTTDAVVEQKKFKHKVVPRFKHCIVQEIVGRRIFENGITAVENIVRCRRRKSKFLQSMVSF